MTTVLSLETIRLLRNILLRTFAVGAGIHISSALITFLAWDQWLLMIQSLIDVNPHRMTMLVIEFYAVSKFLLMFVVLPLALALHWTLKCETAPQHHPPVT